MKYGIYLTIFDYPCFDDGIISKEQQVVNMHRPVKIESLEARKEFYANKPAGSLVILADKATLLDNHLDLCEGDFE